MTAEVLVPLEFNAGFYHFNMPLTIPAALLPRGMRVADVIRFRAVINSVLPNPPIISTTHVLNLEGSEHNGTRVTLNLTPNNVQAPDSTDLHLSYAMCTDQISAALLVEPPQQFAADPRGSFALFVSPPSQPVGQLARHVVFVIDRSGSMTGEPYEEACRALDVAMMDLRPGDWFNVVAFDGNQSVFNLTMVPAAPAAAQAASLWVRQNGPQGGATDINTPLMWAMKLLQEGQDRLAASGATALPVVVLLTDGCVDNERQIVRNVQMLNHGTRIHTFGIGPYCNWYFLKMLSFISKGFNANVMTKEKIQPEIIKLMQQTQLPLLTDVQLVMQVQDCELYPFPIPDLFGGSPLTVAGKWAGPAFPESITLQGRLPNGQMYQQRVYSTASALVPVNKVFVRQRLDLLIAKVLAL